MGCQVQKHFGVCAFLLSVMTIESLCLGFFGGVKQSVSCHENIAAQDPVSDTLPCQELDVSVDSLNTSSICNATFAEIFNLESNANITMKTYYLAVCKMRAGTLSDSDLIGYERAFFLVLFGFWVGFQVIMEFQAFWYRISILKQFGVPVKAGTLKKVEDDAVLRWNQSNTRDGRKSSIINGRSGAGGASPRIAETQMHAVFKNHCRDSGPQVSTHYSKAGC